MTKELALYQSPSGLIRSLIEGFRVRDLCCRIGLAIVLALASRPYVAAQQSRISGTFVLHKFAKAIGNETYSTETKDDMYVLTSQFLFTDPGSKVPLRPRLLRTSRI
jgi:hypothetical protein